MKYLITFLLFMFASTSAFAIICNTGRTNSFDNAGNILEDSRDKCFVRVSNVDQGSLLKGFVVVIDPTQTGANGAFEIASTTDNKLMPHCVLSEACEVGKKCLCQVYGYSDFLQHSDADADGVAGEAMFISDGLAGYIEAINGSSVLVASNYPIGVFIESPTGTGDFKGFIRLL